MKKFTHFLRHLFPLLILGFFIVSFFLGIKNDPEYVDIAASPYGLFSYFIVTALTAFIPALATIPVVATATVIWGPWVAGIIAMVGWTIGSITEYAAAYYSINALLKFFEAKHIEEKIARVRNSVKIWQLFIARLIAPPFVFGMVKTPFWDFVIASMLTYIPLAIGGILGGELLGAYMDKIQPLIMGAALILLIFTLDFFLVRSKHEKPKE